MSLGPRDELDLLRASFPWHFFLDEEMRIRRASERLTSHCPGFKDGVSCADLLRMERPKISFDYDQWSRAPRTTFTFRTIPEGILLRSQILAAPSEALLLACCQPWSTKIEELKSWGISMEDMGVQDSTWEFLMLMEDRDREHVENVRHKEHLEDVVKQRTLELESLLDLAGVLTENLDPGLFSNSLAEKICEILNVGDCCVFTPSGEGLSLRGCRGGIQDDPPPDSIPSGEGLASRAAQEKRTQFNLPEKICSPVLVEDRLLGVIVIRPAPGHGLAMEDVEALERNLRIVAPAFEASLHREGLELNLDQAAHQRRRLLDVAEKTDPLVFSPGERLGDFRLVRPLGRGGLGNVWEATQDSLNRRVALKILGSVQSVDSETRRRFQEEASEASQIEHFNILEIYTSGESGGTMYMAMELVENCKSMQDYLGVFRAVPVLPDTFFLMLSDPFLKVLDALAAVHKAGVVHGNLHPGNILLDANLEPKLAGFGLAALAGGRLQSDSTTAEGIRPYLSPERAANPTGPARPADDIFSIGAVLHGTLAQPGQPGIVRPEAPEALVAIAERAMRFNPENRYPSISEMVNDLARGKEETRRESRSWFSPFRFRRNPGRRK